MILGISRSVHTRVIYFNSKFISIVIIWVYFLFWQYFFIILGLFLSGLFFIYCFIFYVKLFRTHFILSIIRIVVLTGVMAAKEGTNLVVVVEVTHGSTRTRSLKINLRGKKIMKLGNILLKMSNLRVLSYSINAFFDDFYLIKILIHYYSLFYIAHFA